MNINKLNELSEKKRMLEKRYAEIYPENKYPLKHEQYLKVMTDHMETLNELYKHELIDVDTQTERFLKGQIDWLKDNLPDYKEVL